MSYGSAIPYVKQAFYTAADARSGLSAVKVLRDWPRTEEDTVSADGTPEVVWCGRQGHQDATSDSEVKILTAGTLRLDETFTVWFTAQVLHQDGNMKSASDRVWTIGYELVAVVANAPGLSVDANPEIEYCYVDGVQTDEHTRHLQSGGSASELWVGINCKSRLNATL